MASYPGKSCKIKRLGLTGAYDIKEDGCGRERGGMSAGSSREPYRASRRVCRPPGESAPDTRRTGALPDYGDGVDGPCYGIAVPRWGRWKLHL